MRRIKVSDADKRAREASNHLYQPVPVYSKDGKVLGHVGSGATSVGAAKIAKGPVEYSRRFGVWGWIAKG